MPIDFYYINIGAPSRAVMLTAQALNVELNKIPMDLSKGEQFQEEFLKLNPLHTVPVLVDGDLILWESRAIMCYLANKYSKTDKLYPKDPKMRAIVDLMLNFDMGTLHLRLTNTYAPVYKEGGILDQEKLNKIPEALGWLDNILGNRKWVAGDDMTIADHAIVATVSSIEILDHDVSGYKNISRWYDLCKKTMENYKECNEIGNIEYKQFVQSFLDKL